MGVPRAGVWMLGVIVWLAVMPILRLSAEEAEAPRSEAVVAERGTSAVGSPAISPDIPSGLAAAGVLGAGAALDAATLIERRAENPEAPADQRSAEMPSTTAAPEVTGPPQTAAQAAPTAPAQDPLSAAIAARFADPGTRWPARLGTKDREAIAASYKDTGFRPLWTGAQGWTTAAETVLDRLGRADEDGLDVADYAVPDRPRPSGNTPDPAALAGAEIRLSAAALLYARDARGGRIAPSRISALITPKLDLPSADAVLSRLSAASDAGDALASYNPAYPGYRALKDKLAAARAERLSSPMATLPPGPVVVSRRLASLEAPSRMRHLEGDLVANMERWRWLPAEVAPRYVFVNIPAFTLELVDGGRVVHETRVITGRATTPTPVFSGEIESAVVNPSWFIPPSILKKEILPGLAADPLYAERRGYQVVRRGNQISVRQPPGERNALGFIKFLFPNQHAVYLHDTPSRNLFSGSQRALSHGCVRVEHPFALSDFVLGSDWPEARLRKLVGHGERTIRLAQKLPVHLAYFTTIIDEFGSVRTYDDVYGINHKVREALGLGG